MSVATPLPLSRIRWKLKEVMARYDITGKALAEKLDTREASISGFRNHKTIPRIGGERIEELCAALSDLAGVKIRFTDLFEEVDDEPSN